MDQYTRDILRSVMDEFNSFSYIAPEDIPDIQLYMDQITTFMDAKLSACKRHPEDKILTKTMINNYTKNKLIPPPDKKKYSRDHLLLLIYVYYLKDFLQISDIQTLLGPLTEMCFQKENGKSMQEVYEAAFSLVSGQTDYMTKDLMRRWKVAQRAFPDAEGDEGRFLDVFAFVCLLSFDVYVKKKLIEAVVDELNRLKKESRPESKKTGDPKKEAD